MAELNEQLATIARDVIREMREEGWPDDDIQWSASGAILKQIERDDLDFEPSKEHLAAILALVKQCLKEGDLRQCPYCRQWHTVEQVEGGFCPLKPPGLNG